MSVGVDMKYAVTPALNLTGTINPDFGQVEADPAVVNLSAFETFFSEKRPFFIEGSGTYQFECRDCSLFYSRRIGRAPRGAPTIGSDEFMVHPVQTTILGAAQVDRTRGRLLRRRARGGDAGGKRRHRVRVAAPAARSSSRPRSTPSRGHGASSPISRRSASSSRRHNRRSGGERGVSAGERGHRWYRLRLANREAVGPERLLGRQQRQRLSVGDRCTPAEQRAQLPAARRGSRRSRSVRRDAARSLRDGVVRQNRRRATRG